MPKFKTGEIVEVFWDDFFDWEKAIFLCDLREVTGYKYLQNPIICQSLKDFTKEGWDYYQKVRKIKKDL